MIADTTMRVCGQLATYDRSSILTRCSSSCAGIRVRTLPSFNTRSLIVLVNSRVECVMEQTSSACLIPWHFASAVPTPIGRHPVSYRLIVVCLAVRLFDADFDRHHLGMALKHATFLAACFERFALAIHRIAWLRATSKFRRAY